MKVITIKDPKGTTQVGVEEPRPAHEGAQVLSSPKPAPEGSAA